MSKIQGESKLSFFEATGIIVGHGVGAGILAVPALAASDKPILFVHGKEDPNVPFSDGEALYGFYQGPKDCLFAENARHVETMYRAPAACGEKPDRRIEKYGKNECFA